MPALSRLGESRLLFAPPLAIWPESVYHKGTKHPKKESGTIGGYIPEDRDRDISLLEIYDIQTGERRVLRQYDHLIEAPNWSRDGKSLYYNSRGRIWRYDLEGGDERPLDTGFAENCNNDHVLSPDGRALGVSHSEGQRNYKIYTLPLTGGEPRLVTEKSGSFLHGWSPDGKVLAYCAFRPEEKGCQIYTIPVTGGEETRLTDAPGHHDGPEYSPDGQYIWFNSERSGLMQLWRMKTDGTEQTQMTFDADRNCWFAHPSPDGTKVVYLCYRKGDSKPGEHLAHKQVELRLMNADGSGVQTLVRLFGGQGTINVNSWSPDGRRFAFVSYRLPEQ